ncbi:hypothetical protein PSH03_002176 [Micromonospora sp. PSH03]|uniref:hypothetical protein n=1 Tax=Micromonospora TaxID=1873 RepID=UPI001EE988DD|nr:hypothetical protein [Micromonospora salmantinae]MCG5454181.1 hypothetical protein [Micromonospora salmantinae]
MLPVAFTCPLWWVARWATRVLTSLAVVAALALGAGPATATTATPGPVPTSSAVPASVAAGPLAASCRHSAAPGAARPAAAIPPEAAEESVPTWSVDTPVALPDDQGAIAAGVLPVRAAEFGRLPLLDGTSGRASRAPPGR